MRGLPGAISFRQITPGRSGKENPEDAVDDGAVVAPWSTAAARGEKSFDEFPMPVLELVRSEEHTSELQSRQYLVCRLLLEKKKHMGSMWDAVWRFPSIVDRRPSTGLSE